MKIILSFLLLIFLTAFSFSGKAADKMLVCLPDLNIPRSIPLQMKPSSGNCSKDEKLFEIQKSESGITLLLPYESTPASSQPAGGIPGNPRPAKPYSYY